jgi:hypothetical protein
VSDWSDFCNEVIRLGLYDSPDARYLVDERLGILCRDPKNPTRQELDIAIEQLKNNLVIE